MMKKIAQGVKLFALLTLVGGMLTAVRPSPPSASAAACNQNSSANGSVRVSGNTATAHFTVPQGCKNQTITLASYKAPNGSDGRPYNQQKLFRSVTKTYSNPGKHSLKIKVPDCFYQVDLARGKVINNFSPGNTYAQQNRLLASAHGGNKSCDPKPVKPAPAPQPVKPQQAPPQQPQQSVQNIECSNVSSNSSVSDTSAAACSTVVNQTQTQPPASAQPSTTVVTQAEPAPLQEVPGKGGVLPDTGPGDIAAVGFVWTFMGSVLYTYRGRMDGLVQAVVSKLG